MSLVPIWFEWPFLADAKKKIGTNMASGPQRANQVCILGGPNVGQHPHPDYWGEMHHVGSCGMIGHDWTFANRM